MADFENPEWMSAPYSDIERELEIRSALCAGSTEKMIGTVAQTATRLLLARIGADPRTTPATFEGCVSLLAKDPDRFRCNETIEKAVKAHRFGGTTDPATGDLGAAMLSMVKLQKKLHDDGDRPTTKTHFGVSVPDHRTSRDFVFLLHEHVDMLAKRGAEETALFWRAEVLANISCATEMLKVRRDRLMERYHDWLKSEEASGDDTTYERARLGYFLLEELAVIACLAEGNPAAIGKLYTEIESLWTRQKADIPACLKKVLRAGKEESSDAPPFKKSKPEASPLIFAGPDFRRDFRPQGSVRGGFHYGQQAQRGRGFGRGRGNLHGGK